MFDVTRASSTVLLTTFVALLLSPVLLKTTSAQGIEVEPISAPGDQELYLGPYDPDVYGANANLQIKTGFYDFVGDCPNGTPDEATYYFHTATDVYLIPSESLPADGDALTDASGTAPNTFSNSLKLSIYDGLVGITKPSGNLGSGTYAVVYDECQNGTFDTDQDALFGPVVYEVNVPVDVPPLPSIADAKAAAADQSDKWASASRVANGILIGSSVATIANAIYGAWTESFAGVATWISGQTICRVTDAFLESPDPFSFPDEICVGGVPTLDGISEHYAGIAADPPDSSFYQLTPLGRREIVRPLRTDSLIVEAARMTTLLRSEEELLKAFLSSMERYQGADNAGDGEWALVHARATRRYALLADDLLPEVDAAVGHFADAVEADSRPLEESVEYLDSLRARVDSSGFTQEEIQTAHDLGLSDAEIQDQKEKLLAVESYSFDRAAMIDTLEQVQNTISALRSAFSGLATDLGPVISDLESKVSAPLPVAESAGPYAGQEGASIAFDASGTSSPSPIASYEWDFDGDGNFDDATGTTPSYTYDAPFEGLVGLRVTNADNRSSVDYAFVDVANVNSAPVITTSSPGNQALLFTAGSSQSFSVATSDPDGDPVDVTWRVDSTSVDSTGAFTYSPSEMEVGTHLVEAVITDAAALGGKTTVRWFVGVTPQGGATPQSSQSAETKAEMSERYLLKAPYPNPFTGSEQATVAFGVREAGEQIRVALYSVLGRWVRTLYKGTPPAGQLQTVRLKAAGLSSGLYILRLQTSSGATRSQTITLVR